MGDVRRSDHDLPAASDHRVVAELETGLSRFDHEHLCIGVLVQLRTGTGCRVHEDDRERNVPVLCTDELVCVLGVRKVVELHDRGHLSLLLECRTVSMAPWLAIIADIRAIGSGLWTVTEAVIVARS